MAGKTAIFFAQWQTSCHNFKSVLLKISLLENPDKSQLLFYKIFLTAVQT